MPAGWREGVGCCCWGGVLEGVGPPSRSPAPGHPPLSPLDPRVCRASPYPPQSYQTDWEAILEISPERFLASVAAWMLPPEVPALPSLAAAARGGGGGGDGGSSEAAAPPPCKPVDQLPKVGGRGCTPRLPIVPAASLFLAPSASSPPPACTLPPRPARWPKCWTPCVSGWRRSTAPTCPASSHPPPPPRACGRGPADEGSSASGCGGCISGGGAFVCFESERMRCIHRLIVLLHPLLGPKQ